MFVITNRQIHADRKGMGKVGDRPSDRGPNELRVLEATRRGSGWSLEILDDELSKADKARLGLDVAETWFASRLAAQRVFQRARSRKRHVLFLVPGYNHDLQSLLEQADGLSRRFKVEVVAFSWPANGGGIHGALNYLSDKRDALASVGALDRCLALFHRYLGEFHQPDCTVKLSLLAHSMGVYLLKHVMLSSAYRGDHLTFDNIVLSSSDVNNARHREWVDRMQVRSRLFITLNEDDLALAAARMKSGEEQLARLGHYRFQLDARSATYVDFTGAAYVTDAHTLFQGAPLRNPAIRHFFLRAFHGERAEEDLVYAPATGTYRFP